MKAFIAGGGTGGHFYPAVSVAEELQKRGISVEYFGTQRGIENKKEFPASEKYLFPIEGVRGKNPFFSLLSGAKLIKTSLRISSIIKERKPDFVISFGGYSSLPLGIAAFLTGTPLFIHEQNSIPSYTNKILSFFAKKVFITFEYSKKYFPEKKVVLSGLPVRKQLKEDIKIPKEKARKILGLSEKPVILVFGGSQGSRKISELAIKAAKDMKDISFVLIGGKNFQKPDNLLENISYYKYFDRMGILYSAADIVVSRAGAATVYELILSGKSGIFVPYPYAASNHQYYNVKWLSDKKLAQIVIENNLTEEVLKKKISDSLSCDLKSLEKNIKSFGIENSEEIIVDEILNEISKI